MSVKMAEVDINYAATKKSIDVATPTSLHNSIKFPFNSTSISTTTIASPLLTPKITSQATQSHNQLRPCRRLARSLSCPTDASIATTAPKHQRTRRKTNIQAHYNHQKENSKYSILHSDTTQGSYTKNSPPINWISEKYGSKCIKSAISIIEQVEQVEQPDILSAVSIRSSDQCSNFDSNCADKAGSRVNLNMISCRLESSTLPQSTRDLNLSRRSKLSGKFGKCSDESGGSYLKSCTKEDVHKQQLSSKIGYSSAAGRRVSSNITFHQPFLASLIF